MRIVLCIALGLGIGGVSGTLGIGGGVLLLPLLMWVFGLEQYQAAGITLAVLSVPVTLPGAYHYYSRELIKGEHLEMAAWIAVAFAVGTFSGASVLYLLSPSVLRISFGLMMIFVAVRFIVNSKSETANVYAGLIGVSLGGLLYLILRLLGRRHLVRPTLHEQILKAEQEGRGEIDYHI